MFTDIFSIVFSFLALITIHWSVGIVTILLFAVMMLLPGLLQKGVEKHSIALKEENEIFVSSVEDQLQGRMEYAVFQKENIAYEYSFIKPIKIFFTVKYFVTM